MHEAVVGKAPVVRDWKVAALVGVVEDRIPGLASGEPALWSASLEVREAILRVACLPHLFVLPHVSAQAGSASWLSFVGFVTVQVLRTY